MSATFLRAFMPGLVGAPVGQPTSEWPLPTSVEWMPAGDHDIRASLGGEPAEVKVSSGPEDAARLDAQLQEILARSSRGECSRPYIDFDHEGKEAAAIPVRFFWADGIRLAVEWTESGAESLKGREYSYFSPEFLLGEDGHPSAIPDHGPIGALVNTPAFQTIQRLAAKQKIASPTEEQPKAIIMKLLLAALAGAKLIPSADNIDDEKASTAVVASLAKRDSDTQTLEASLTTERTAREKAEADLAKCRKDLAEAAVAADVKAGLLKDDATLRAKWVDSYTKDYDGTKALIAGMAEARPAPAARGVPLESIKAAKDAENEDEIVKAYEAEKDPVKRAKLWAKHRDTIVAAARR